MAVRNVVRDIFRIFHEPLDKAVHFLFLLLVGRAGETDIMPKETVLKGQKKNEEDHDPSAGCCHDAVYGSLLQLQQHNHH
jgi:hypothetical protein